MEGEEQVIWEEEGESSLYIAGAVQEHLPLNMRHREPATRKQAGTTNSTHRSARILLETVKEGGGTSPGGLPPWQSRPGNPNGGVKPESESSWEVFYNGQARCCSELPIGPGRFLGKIEKGNNVGRYLANQR